MNLSSGIRSTLRHTLLAALLSAGMLLPTSAAFAQPPQFNPVFSVADNLAALKGRTATVHLASGQSITGVVKDLGDHMLHIERISQREFFDALIRIDSIVAVEARVR